MTNEVRMKQNEIIRVRIESFFRGMAVGAGICLLINVIVAVVTF